MADQKFPGTPWKANTDTANGYYVDTFDGGLPVAKIFEGFQPEQLETITRLMAAAPELLDALKGIEWRGIYGGDLSCLFCYSFETDGHMEDCKWQALIASVDGKE